MKLGISPYSRWMFFAMMWIAVAQFSSSAFAFSAAPHAVSIPVGVYLNPNTGRFWSMDSHEGDNEDPLSLHKYLYAWCNPVNHIDPSGHEIEGFSISFAVSIVLAQMPNLISVGMAVKNLPIEGEKILIDRYNMAKAYLESRNVEHGGKNTASCISVNQPLGHFLGPMPSHWICRLEHRSHYISIFGLGNWLPDHWAVVCRTAPDVPIFKELLFDYWGDRPAGENPKAWFRNHYEGILPGSYDYTYNQYQKPCDYKWLDVLPIGAN